eukprot:364586-Chlamydomonas_euryale.AAC.3
MARTPIGTPYYMAPEIYEVRACAPSRAWQVLGGVGRGRLRWHSFARVAGAGQCGEGAAAVALVCARGRCWAVWGGGGCGGTRLRAWQVLDSTGEAAAAKAPHTHAFWRWSTPAP